jgi:hypothetical protein
VEPPDIEKLVGELEVAVDRVRSLYEQYFMGIEKLEPAVPRKDVERRIHVLRKEQIRNTAQRFRFQMILQRYNVYQTHWQRICREIENGTYKRHLVRAHERFDTRPPPARAPAPQARPEPGVHLPQPGASLPRELAAELAELDREFALARASSRPPPPPKGLLVAFPAQAPKAPPPLHLPAPAMPPAPRPLPPPSRPPRSSAPPPLEAPSARRASSAPQPNPRGVVPPMQPASPPAKGDEGLSEDRVRQLYARYVELKRRQNESTAAITYDAVARSLRESSAKLREKHGKPVDFEVTVKDGKAILKPVLK